ncbi:hypothetical protein QBC40DRAFT_274683 [Triangularia verruculosa]|uniref:DUF7770 domain-containing protein n=1 Tax=Triangularia verruculosa TaxID=2587418 RepID=A0AAN7AW21_9PEZI|nr:hypothetical protein QBC40DRAFT_274683 [Triangularia verruculosa]
MSNSASPDTSAQEPVDLGDNWDLSNLAPSDSSLTATVSTIHLCCLRNDLNEGDENGEPPTSHWVLCLQIAPDSSIMLDMAPGYGTDGLRGKIEASSLPGVAYTDETLHAFSYTPLKSDITVAAIAKLINDKGRNAFNFSPEWEGCRFWLTVIMKDLEEAGIVKDGSAEQAAKALLLYWRNPEGSGPRVMREGVFRGE